MKIKKYIAFSLKIRTKVRDSNLTILSISDKFVTSNFSKTVQASYELDMDRSVEVLQTHSTTLSHRSSGSTVCFLPQEAALLGVHPCSHWNRDFLSVLSHYISDHNVIIDH
jgi:hypothetical protein